MKAFESVPNQLPPNATPSTKSVIECQGVWKVFSEDPHAVRRVLDEGISKDEALANHDAVVAVANVTFCVERGEIFCIMGLSGSGKSTLVRHINRLIEPSAGKIIINGVDIGVLTAPELREMRAEQIGMVFQNMALLPHRDVRDNVAFGLELRGVSVDKRREIADETLERVQLTGWGDRFPSELSGGMQQRVGLARALSGDPEILLMDEPFSALDPLIRRRLQDQFLALSSVMHKTTVFITHDLDEAIRLGDRIAIMKDGELVQIGTPEDIVLSPVDDYVADFVQGISKLSLVSAGTVMQPLGSAKAHESAPRVSTQCSLKDLVDVCVGSEHPAVVVDEDNQPAGQIDARGLLSAIKELG